MQALSLSLLSDFLGPLTLRRPHQIFLSEYHSRVFPAHHNCWFKCLLPPFWFSSLRGFLRDNRNGEEWPRHDKHLWRVPPWADLKYQVAFVILNKSLPSVCHPGLILNSSLTVHLKRFSGASFGAWHPANLSMYIHKTEMSDCGSSPGFFAFPNEFPVSKKLVYVLLKKK